MVINEFEIKRCEKELEKFIEQHKSPVHVREQVNISYRIKDQRRECDERSCSSLF